MCVSHRGRVGTSNQPPLSHPFSQQGGGIFIERQMRDNKSLPRINVYPFRATYTYNTCTSIKTPALIWKITFDNCYPKSLFMCKSYSSTYFNGYDICILFIPNEQIYYYHFRHKSIPNTNFYISIREIIFWRFQGIILQIKPYTFCCLEV